jgi:colicin import membrane protein
MWQVVRENPRAVVYAVLMHAGLLLLLVFSLDWTPKSVKPGTTRPIQAELVDMSKQREIEAQEKAAKEKAAKEKAAKEKAAKEKAAKEQAAKEKAAKEQAVKEKAAKEKAAKEKAAKEKAAKEQAAKEKAAKEQAVKEQAAKEKAAKEQAAKEQAAKEKAAAERKQKAEQEAKRKAEAEAAQQREAEKALQAQLAEEAAQARAQSKLSEFIPYIQDKVQNNWLRPAGSQPGLSCVIQVTLIPGGDVVGTRVVQSSGNALFDASVERAVQKASPLPLPNDPALFKYFREINFRFVPD